MARVTKIEGYVGSDERAASKKRREDNKEKVNRQIKERRRIVRGAKEASLNEVTQESVAGEDE